MLTWKLVCVCACMRACVHACVCVWDHQLPNVNAWISKSFRFRLISKDFTDFNRFVWFKIPQSDLTKPTATVYHICKEWLVSLTWLEMKISRLYWLATVPIILTSGFKNLMMSVISEEECISSSWWPLCTAIKKVNSNYNNKTLGILLIRMCSYWCFQG